MSPIDISSKVLAWKNADDRDSPMVYLYEVDIDDSTTLRLVEGDPLGTGSLDYDGETYSAAVIKREDTEQNIRGDFPSTTVTVSNIDGTAGGYIEQYELDGQEARIISVPLETLDPADAQTETFTIGPVSYDRRVATFSLGPPNFFRRKSSRRKFLRHRCGHDWENRFRDGNECGYPSDFFEADTVQDFLVGAVTDDEQARKYGWYTLNATKADAFNVGGELDTNLYIAATGDDLDWDTANQSAPFVYKKFSGDFDVYTLAAPLDTRLGAIAGILCQEESDGYDSWILVGRAQDTGGDLFIRAAAAVDGVAQADLTAADSSSLYVRLKRVGNEFTAYYSSDAETWTSLGAQTLTLETDVRLGLALAAPGIESGPVSASFDVFRVTAGGVSLCERTLEFCSQLGNTHRIYSFPGTPRV